jgi:hypothetical protein
MFRPLFFTTFLSNKWFMCWRRKRNVSGIILSYSDTNLVSSSFLLPRRHFYKRIIIRVWLNPSQKWCLSPILMLMSNKLFLRTWETKNGLTFLWIWETKKNKTFIFKDRFWYYRKCILDIVGMNFSEWDFFIL